MAGKLEGTDRGLDALVGLVIVVTSVLIGALAIAGLYDYGSTAPAVDEDAINAGFAIAVIGSVLALGITTLIYLIRVAIGRRSFTTALWGLILMTVAIFIGWLVMSSGT